MPPIALDGYKLRNALEDDRGLDILHRDIEQLALGLTAVIVDNELAGGRQNPSAASHGVSTPVECHVKLTLERR